MENNQVNGFPEPEQSDLHNITLGEGDKVKPCNRHPELKKVFNRPYGLGFHQGLIRSKFEASDTVVETNTLLKKFGHLLRLCCEEITRLESLIEKGNLRLKVLKESVARKKAEIFVHRDRHAFLQDKIVYFKNLIDKTTETIEGIKPIHGLWMGIVYVLTGFVFLLTDYEINRQVFRGVLNMKADESKIFAIGVALIAFILKPAVDRVFEKNYPTDPKVKKKNHVLLLAVASLAIISLGLLGLYRGFNLEFLISEYDLEGTRAKPILMIYAMFLFTVLFAIAGAISFSIGSPVLREYLTLYSYRVYRFRKRIEFKLLFNRAETVRKKIGAIMPLIEVETEEADKLQVELADFITELENQKQIEHQLLEQYYEEENRGNKASYKAGFENGSIYNLKGKLEASPTSQSKYYKTKNGNSGSVNNAPKYIHQKLRDEIKQKFNNPN